MSHSGEITTLGEEVRERIRMGILAGRWRPGEKLHITALADLHNTSNTVTREALTRLVGARLVRLRPNRGFYVAELSESELRDLNELRCRIEAFAIELAVERGDLEWESELFAAHHRLERTPRSTNDLEESTDAWTVAHRAFHAKLIEACGVPAILELSRSLADSMALYWRWMLPAPAVTGQMTEIIHEHNELLQAVLARDSAQATEILRRHYTRAMKQVIERGTLVWAD